LRRDQKTIDYLFAREIELIDKTPNQETTTRHPIQRKIWLEVKGRKRQGISTFKKHDKNPE